MFHDKPEVVELFHKATANETYQNKRSQLIEIARLAENAERFEDMCKLVRAIVELDTQHNEARQKSGDESLDPNFPEIQFSTDERNLLSVAYKHVVSSRRTSWRTLNNDDGRSNDFVQEYRRQLEVELQAVCREVLDLLELHLIPQQRKSIEACSQEPGNTELNTYREGMVFYLKLCGDYYRYLAEFQDRASGSHERARLFYDEAYSLAKTKVSPNSDEEVLPRTNPVRLGLALNFSVCFYEILEEKDQACALAREAFDAALSKLDDLEEHHYKDSTLILMLLRDNLTLWSEPHDKHDLSAEMGY